MWGPVVTDPDDDFYCDCTIASNNTGELLGMYNVLAWAKRQGGQEPIAICFDSMYARNVTSGVWKPKKNKGIGSLCFEAFTAYHRDPENTCTKHLDRERGHFTPPKVDDTPYFYL